LRGRVVGYHDGATYYRTVKPEHVLRHPHALAIDEGVLRSLADDGITRVILTSSDGETVYHAPTSAFWEYGVELDRGHGRQRALPLTAFFVVTVSQPSLPGDWPATFGEGS